MTSFLITTAVTSDQTLAANEVGTITASGSLISTGAAVTLGSATLVNEGLISAGNYGILVSEAGARLVNTGTIIGSFVGIESNLVSTGLTFVLTNYGSISGMSSGGDGIILRGNGNSIANYGTISGMSDDAIQITGNGQSVGTNWITNDGTLSGTAALTSDQSVVHQILNTGRMIGTQSAIQLDGNAADSIRNSGSIVGNVLMGAGSDTYDGRGGTLDGTLYGEADNDIYLIDDSNISIFEGVSDGALDVVQSWANYTLADNIEQLFLFGAAVRGTGNAQANTITGSAIANALDGEAGNDVLTGLAGNDSLVGDTGDDSLNGGSSADVIWGGVGKDTLVGGYDDDRLYGGSENDRIFGNFGDDLIQGGRGKDSMTGGDDADTFVFASAADAGNGAQGDVITDFTSGTDHIDLSGIDANTATSTNNAFTIVAAFTGAAGQLILRASGGNTFVEGDVNGNGTADFSIQLTGVTSVLASDLIV